MCVGGGFVFSRFGSRRRRRHRIVEEVSEVLLRFFASQHRGRILFSLFLFAGFVISPYRWQPQHPRRCWKGRCVLFLLFALAPLPHTPRPFPLTNDTGLLWSFPGADLRPPPSFFFVAFYYAAAVVVVVATAAAAVWNTPSTRSSSVCACPF